MFQGEPDFLALARNESLVFAIVKATEGQGYCDPKWERNHKLAPSSFEFTGCYHVLRGTSDGVAQADHAGRQWERLAAVCASARSHVMPVALDFEIADKRAPQWLIDNACAFRVRIEAITGLRPIVYSYPSFLREQGGNIAPDLLADCPQWPALYVGKKWADVAAGFDPYEWLRARKMLPALWERAEPWAIYQYDGDKGEYHNGVDFDFNVARSRDVLRTMCGLPMPVDEPPDTQPQTPKSKSSDQLKAVDAPIIDGAATPLRAGEGEHTPIITASEDGDL